MLILKNYLGNSIYLVLISKWVVAMLLVLLVS